MKSLFLAVAVCSVLAVQAQSDKYTQAMERNLVALDSAKAPADYQVVTAAFERIGDAEKTQWLPYYYAALAELRIGFTDKAADKDAVANKANELLGKAEVLEKDNSDLYTIRNMIATMQMLVDPMTRWQTYGQQASAALQTGMKLNPNNPRLYYLQGMSLFGTPPQFGGGKDKAKPVFEKAVALAKAETVKPLYPGWGGKEAEKMVAACQ